MASESLGGTLSQEIEVDGSAVADEACERAHDEGAHDESDPDEGAGWRRADSGESASERRALDALLADALVAKAELVALVAQERTAKVRQLRALQRFEAKGYHRALCVSVADLAVEVGVARTQREAKDLLRTAKHLERVPRIDAAFGAGEIDWTKVRDVGPVLTPETEEVWLPRLATWTNAQLQARVREDQDLPPLRRFSFSATLVVGADYDQLAVELRRSADRALTDDEVFAEIVQRALHGLARKLEAESPLDGEGEAAPEGEVVVKASTDRLRPSTTVVMYRCDDCKRTTTESRHGTVEVPEETYETRRCNSATLDVRDGPGRVTRTIPPRTANQVLARDRFGCRVPGCGNRTWIDIHHEGGREVVGHDPAAMLVVCTFHHAELHRGHMRAETTGETIRFLRRDGVELCERGPAAELPHVGQTAVLADVGQVVIHEADP